MRISDWSSDVCSSDLLGLSLAREADDACGADGEVRADRTPALDAFKRLVYRTPPLHYLQHARSGVLEREFEVRQQPRPTNGFALPTTQADFSGVRDQIAVTHAAQNRYRQGHTESD